MDNDRIFTLYAFTLIAGVASIITASIAAGVASVPSAAGFLEHLAMSLTFRAAYKSFGGFDWVYRVAELAGMITRETAMSPQLPAEAAS